MFVGMVEMCRGRRSGRDKDTRNLQCRQFTFSFKSTGTSSRNQLAFRHSSRNLDLYIHRNVRLAGYAAVSVRELESTLQARYL